MMQVRCPEAGAGTGSRGEILDEGDNNAEASESCDWAGNVKDIEAHENVCNFKTIECSVEGCMHTCKRKDLSSHLSSNTALLMHMELKYENKLKAMDVKYENRIQAYENRLQAMEQRYQNRMQAMEQTLGMMGTNHQRSTDTCTICRNSLNEQSVEYQANPRDDNDLSIAYGNCGHVFHLDCIQRWRRTMNVCHVCNQEWDFSRIVRVQSS